MKMWTLILLIAASLFGASLSFAQTVPVCPSSPIYAYFSPTGSPITDVDPIKFWIRQPSASGLWDFQPGNFIVSGANITATATGVLGGGVGAPAPVGIFGPLAAGTYTVSVVATATNVVPNVQCAPFVSQLIVRQSAGAGTYEPVPIGSLWSSFLLLCSLALAGAFHVGRSRSQQ